MKSVLSKQLNEIRFFLLSLIFLLYMNIIGSYGGGGNGYYYGGSGSSCTGKCTIIVCSVVGGIFGMILICCCVLICPCCKLCSGRPLRSNAKFIGKLFKTRNELQ